MAYTKGSFNLDAQAGVSNFPQQLGLKNVGFSVYVLQRGDGFDYLHNHREQEEVYFCAEGTAELVVADANNGELKRLALERGEAIKVDPGTLRAIGNATSDRVVIIIAGGCPHPYPAGHGHDVIADVLRTVEHGDTGFRRPDFLSHEPPEVVDPEC